MSETNGNLENTNKTEHDKYRYKTKNYEQCGPNKISRDEHRWSRKLEVPASLKAPAALSIFNSGNSRFRVKGKFSGEETNVILPHCFCKQDFS